MKVWYDRKTKSRSFEPGDRVLVVLPVIGNPLQAKYCIKLVKKISDKKYLVRGPCKHKETQVCHINILKAYHEKPKPELVTLNNKLGLEHPTYRKEEDTESEVRLGNYQQPIKLQNSQIFNVLSTKPSHLTLWHILSWQCYWQVPLTQRAREISTYVRPSDLSCHLE